MFHPGSLGGNMEQLWSFFCLMNTARKIAPTQTRIEEIVPVWDFEFITNAVTL
jgi:hypothetical protein